MAKDRDIIEFIDYINKFEGTELSEWYSSNLKSYLSLGAGSSDEGRSNIKFIEALSQHKTITSFNLRGKDIGEDGAIVLAKAIESNHHITSISLSGYSIKNFGFITLAEAIKVSTSLKSIELDEIGIRDYEATALAEAISNHPSITSINLVRNDMGDAGAIALADAIKENQSLTSINLEGNNIGDAGAIALAEAIKDHPTKIIIIFSDNNISDKIDIALKEAIKINSSKPSNTENTESPNYEAGTIEIEEELEVEEVKSSSLIAIDLTHDHVNTERNETIEIKPSLGAERSLIAIDLSINASVDSFSYSTGKSMFLETEESFILGLLALGELPHDTAS